MSSKPLDWRASDLMPTSWIALWVYDLFYCNKLRIRNSNWRRTSTGTRHTINCTPWHGNYNHFCFGHILTGFYTFESTGCCCGRFCKRTCCRLLVKERQFQGFYHAEDGKILKCAHWMSVQCFGLNMLACASRRRCVEIPQLPAMLLLLHVIVSRFE